MAGWGVMGTDGVEGRVGALLPLRLQLAPAGCCRGIVGWLALAHCKLSSWLSLLANRAAQPVAVCSPSFWRGNQQRRGSLESFIAAPTFHN